jgi:triosephosphate isomerase
MAEEVHLNIRKISAAHKLECATSIPILYGGSVSSGNCQALFEMDNINGGLIGGASLDSAEFIKIYQTAEDLNK